MGLGRPTRRISCAAEIWSAYRKRGLARQAAPLACPKSIIKGSPFENLGHCLSACEIA
jgi:hypothetical protein